MVASITPTIHSQVKVYGSFATGLLLPSSDLDVVLCLPNVQRDATADQPFALEGRNAVKESWQQVGYSTDVMRCYQTKCWLYLYCISPSHILYPSLSNTHTHTHATTTTTTTTSTTSRTSPVPSLGARGWRRRASRSSPMPLCPSSPVTLVALADGKREGRCCSFRTKRGLRAAGE